MRIVRVTMYQCEFCHKRMLKRRRAESHESLCLHNPNRKCTDCGRAGVKAHMVIAVSEKLNGNVDHIEAIKHLTGGCPRCMLAAVFAYNEMLEPGAEPLKFDYHALLRRRQNLITAGGILD